MTTLTEWDANEWAARQFEANTDNRWASPGAVAAALEPRTIQTPALELIDQALTALVDTTDGRLIITMPPQEGKSTRVAKDFVIWLLTHDPELRVVTASYSQSLANRNGRAIRNTVAAHPELGLAIAPDNGSVSDWTLEGHDGGVLSVGIGAGVTGRPADVMVIDDPIKDRKEADSETFRDSRWDWWTDAASTRLAPGAPVVVILTRWHEDDFAGRLLAAEDGDIWTVLNIPAEADHRPEKGETDVLGRQPGEFMQSARTKKNGQPRSVREWLAIKRRSGARTWASLYQGRPAPATGDILHREWWQYYDTPLHVERPDGSCVLTHFDELILSWDMAFKDTAASDYVVGQVWLRRGVDAYLLDQIRGRMDFVETCRKVRAQSAKWPQAVLKLVEDKANGTAVISQLSRTVGGIVPEEPVGGKEARAYAVTPVIEAGNVYLPAVELAPWVDDFVEECASFPAGKNDDQVDAMTQAVNRLLIMPLLTDNEIYGDEDIFGDDDQPISPY
jgi:predicted phage terminase large subunit-like protein